MFRGGRLGIARPRVQVDLVEEMCGRVDRERRRWRRGSEGGGRECCFHDTIVFMSGNEYTREDVVRGMWMTCWLSMRCDATLCFALLCFGFRRPEDDVQEGKGVLFICSRMVRWVALKEPRLPVGDDGDVYRPSTETTVSDTLSL
jgi:hypothetical protein